MTPLLKRHLRKSELFTQLKQGIRNEPYIIINVIFAGIVLLIFAYSGIFSPDKDNYPVVCIHQKLTGEPCPSCGLSHSFSLIVRGRIQEAFKWNVYGLRVFIFFAAQLLMRIMFSVFYLKYPSTGRELVLFDALGSVLIFFISFFPFIATLRAGFF